MGFNTLLGLSGSWCPPTIFCGRCFSPDMDPSENGLNFKLLLTADSNL